jgi:hypothetical protein
LPSMFLFRFLFSCFLVVLLLQLSISNLLTIRVHM